MKPLSRLRNRSFRFFSALLVTLVSAAGLAPQAFAALIEAHTPVTYNMQGSTAANQSKWTTDVLPLTNTHDVVALQEAGPAPPGDRISQYTTPEGQVTETLWNVGTNASPSYRYVYFLQTDPTGNRVNLAIVTRVGADDVTTIPGGIAPVSRGALGVRLGEMWFFTIHGLSPGGNDDAGLLRNIESANLFGLFWAALGDFNRDPGALVVPSDAIIYHPGTSTQQSGGELDYMVSNDVVTCPPEDLKVTAQVLGGLSSDHYPVDFPVVPCPDNGANPVAPLTLMSVGDTTVVGSDGSPMWTNSYRGDLQNDLSGDGLSWIFVGTQQSGNLSDPYHEGYNQALIGRLDALATPNVGNIKPNLITVVAGGEDIQEAYQTDSAPSRMASMVEDFFNADPGATIIVATATPPLYSGNVPITQAFNSKLAGVVENEQQHGRHILLADLGPLTSSNFYYPLAAASGYQIIADAFNTDILTAISLGWLAHPVPCGSGPCGPSGGGAGGGSGGVSGRSLPSVCDIYASGGTPCVAAHSTVRALFENYSGNLYRVMRASDSTSMDIEVLASSGYADSAKQDSFCSGTSCTITEIFDQTSFHNDLGIEGPGGTVPTGDSGAVADALPITVNGNKVYGINVTAGVGYRDNATSGVAKGSSPEGMYMVTSGTNVDGAGAVNDGCCFDYGNGEANSSDNGNGHMDALNFGTNCFFPPCSGSGPWVAADLENGLFQGNGSNPGNQTINSDFVTAMLKNDGKTTFALKAGNSQSGGLTTEYSGTLPTSGGYIPMSLEGGIMLGTGGDNSNWSIGSFFEGAMTSGYPTDATEDAVQANIVAAGYTGSSGSSGSGGGSGGGSGSGDVGFPNIGGAVYTGPSDPDGPGPQDGFGSPAAEQPNDLMESKPALASFRGSLYAAFQGVNADNDLYVTSSATGADFPTAARYTNIKMASAPAMAEFNNQLYVAFQGVNANDNFYVTSSTDGINFPSATRHTNILIGGAPALAVFNNQLYAAFQADDPGHTLHITASSDGNTWPTAWQIPNVLIGSAPAMASFRGRLYVAFRADDASDNVYIASSADGIHFTSQALAGQLTGGHSAPALVASYNTLYCIYGASDSGNEMLVTASTDGTTWQGPKAYLNNNMGTTGPAAAAFDSGVYVGFQSNDSRGVLFVTANVPPQASVYTGPNDPGGPGPQDGFGTPALGQPFDAIGTKPALASFRGVLFAAFQANDATHTLFVTSSPGGTIFPQATDYTNIKMGSAPGMAEFNNQLFVAFQANDQTHSFFVTSSTTGTAFPDATDTSIKVGGAPALAAFNNQLYAAFQADDPSHTLFVTSSPDGKSWPNANPIPNVHIGSDPAMASFKGNLYVAFRADDGSNNAFIASSSDGINFSSQVLAGQHMGWSSAPALVVSNNTLYYIYGAEDSGNEMLVMASTDGITWQGPAAYPGNNMSAAGPAAASFDNGAYVGFQSNDAKDLLFVTANIPPQQAGYIGPTDAGFPTGPQDKFTSPAAPQPGIAMGTKPGLASFNGSLYAAFQANDATHTLFVTSSSSGADFPQATDYTNITMGSAPALAVFNNRLYAAFQANDPTHSFFVTSSSTGADFPNATDTSIKVGGAPALAVFNNQLYAAFQADDLSHTLFVTSSSDGQAWPNAHPISNVHIGSEPSMVSFKGNLYVAFRADDASNNAFIASSSDGINFKSSALFGNQMGWSSAPALAVSNNTLYYIYGSNDFSNEMLVFSTQNGIGWFGPAVYTSILMGYSGPAATEFNGSVAVGFQAGDITDALFLTYTH